MIDIDHYKVLGIDKTATHAQVTSAFRKKVLEYHPDRNHSPGAKEMFIKAHQAFEVLGNPERRSAYDYLHSQPQSQPYGTSDSYRQENGYYEPEYKPSSTPEPQEVRVPRWKVYMPIWGFGAIVGIIYIITEIIKALGWH
jgi:curved DNA-binding protein CbpA